MKRELGTIFSVVLFIMSCGHSTMNSTLSVNPRDTVNVPDYLTGEDSVAYIENTVLQSPITAVDLLNLAEVHSIETRLLYYNHLDLVKEHPEYAEQCLPTQRDSAAMRLANRFMRMSELISSNGNANDKLEWAVAVNAVLDSFRVAIPSVPSDYVLDEIVRVIDKFSSQTQSEMNFQCYVDATVEYYRTVEAYRQWLLAVPKFLQSLMQEEYEAWHDLNEARFSFWHDVSYNQEWYSMKPMEIEGYYANLAENRLAELKIERDVILRNGYYMKKGQTVTTGQWEAWIKEHSVPEDFEIIKEIDDDRIPSPSIVTARVKTLKTKFSRWLNARQAIAAALPEDQGEFYDNITADIHCRLIGKLDDIIPYEVGEIQ